MIIVVAGAMPYAQANTSSSHPYLLKWGESGLTQSGLFSFPQNLAIDDLGNVYVTESGNKRVQKFNNDGTFLKGWGGSGTDQGKFQSPAGIAVYKDAVFVVDTQSNRVQKFDLSGNFISTWGSEGKAQGQFLLPNGIAAGTNETIYVVDTGNKRIQKFTPNGEFISEFGQSGIENDKFITPIGIAIDNQENIFVSDTGKNKILKFNSDGIFSQSYGPNFAGLQIIPQGMTITPSGNIYVADSANDRMLLISKEGATITTWGSMGTANGQFKYPKDIALDKNGYLFVVDTNGHRIQKFGSPMIPSSTETVSSSNTATSQQTVTTPKTVTSSVNPIPGDLTKPLVTPPNDLLIEATGGLTPVSVGQAMATDPSGIQSLTNNAPAQFPLGTTTIIWTAIDGAGNMGIASQVIKVVDTIAPTITILPEIIVEAESPQSNTIILEEPLANDAVGVISIINDAPDVYPVGETLVTWTATDVASNSKSVVQKVIVVDTKPPKLMIPQDIVIDATSYDQNDIYLGEAIVVDNGNIISITNDAPNFFSVGNTTVTWTAADSSGNVASKKQMVSVIDTSVPVITPPENIVYEATSFKDNIIILGTPEVSDIQKVTITNDAPPVFPYGETNVTWLVMDPAGNSATVNQIVTVIDTTSPTLIIPGDIVFEATSVDNNKIFLGNATASDIAGISKVSNNSPNAFPFGITVVTWTASDNVGNSISQDQIVTVVDTTAPQIKAPKDIVLEANDNDSNVVDLDLPWSIDIIGVESYTNDAPATFPIGMTTVTWTAVDTSGNKVSDTQVVTIHDTTPPTIIPPSNILVEANTSSGMPIKIGEANVSDLIGVDSITNNAPELFSLGNTTVTWTATDIFGNTAAADQIISIIDTTFPTIYAPSTITIEAKDAQSNVFEIGVADADDTVGIISITNDAPKAFPLGDTIVNWKAIDAAGNIATAPQKISVIDTTPPSIQPPGTVQIEATSQLNNLVELGEATVSDLIGISSVTNDAPDVYPVGETVVTWTAIDLGGLSSKATQIARVVDTTPPKISIPKIITVEANSKDQNTVELVGIFADDLVGVTSIKNDAPQVFPFGLTTITWVASDEAGNIATGMQQISVVDTIAPSIIPPSDIVIEASNAQNNLVNLGKPQSTDLVSVASTTNDAPDVFPLGQTIVTWTVTDTSENTATAIQTVSIIDTTPPTIDVPKDIEIEATSSNENIASLVPPKSADAVSEVTITNNVPKYLPLGETTIMWTATDKEGNSASTTQKITVVDTTAPELTVPLDITIDATSLKTPVNVGEGKAKDLAGSEVTITNDAPFSFPLGETVITWTAVDSFDNTISLSQKITVLACGRSDSYYNLIIGTAEEDILTGTNVADLIFGQEGDDILMGFKGNDCILGGDGDDIIFGNEGNDNLSGGDGNDVIKGQSGEDTITGDFGTDVIDGGDDNDACNISQVPDGDLEIKCEL